VVRSDGLDAKDSTRFRVQALEKKIEKAKGKERARLEEMHNDAMEAMMDMLADGGGNDDFADIDLGLEEEGSEGGIEEGDDAEDDNESEGDAEEEEVANGKDPATSEDDAEPSSFSRIPTAVLHNHLKLPTTAVLPPNSSPSDSFDLKKASIPYIVNLNPGEMLYLPASWWHEVTSSSSNSAQDHTHMAFNYWFYPPDGLDNFEEPYEDELVWGYLRSQLKAAEEKKNGDGKRKRENGVAGSSKKSKR
jgi:hypothetical protein